MNPVDAESLEWADLVFVMTQVHRSRLMQRFRPHLKHARVVCLDVADESSSDGSRTSR